MRDSTSVRQHSADAPAAPPPVAHDHEDISGVSLQNAARPRGIWIAATIVAMLVILAGLFFVGWNPLSQRETRLEADAAQVKSSVPKVTVIAPKLSPPNTELTLPGEIQAVRETTIYARTSGYLKRWLVDIGDSVKSGQLLAEIDSPEVDMQLDQARAAVQQAQATLEQTKASLEQSKAQVVSAQATADLADLTMKRYDSLRGTNAVTEQDISEKEAAQKAAHAAVLSAQAAVVAGQANINSAKAALGVAEAEVRRLEILKSFEQVTAPFDGIITSRAIEVGSLITAGSGTGAPVLFHIVCSNPVRVFIDVPQYSAPSIKAGQNVDVLVREFPGRKFEGAVTRTTKSIDSASRTLRTQIDVPNPSGELLAGMYGQVKINIIHDKPLLVLPGSALVLNAGGTQVALVKDGHVHFQPITVSSDYGPTFGVSSGLSEGDVVISNPGERLVEGMAVTIAAPAQ